MENRKQGARLNRSRKTEKELALSERSSSKGTIPATTTAASVPLPFTTIPPKGKRYIVLWLVMVIFASVFIIVTTSLETLLLVLGVSVLFVIVVSTLVRNFIG